MNGASLMVLQNSPLEDRWNHLDGVQTINMWLGGSQQYKQRRETAESEDKGIGGLQLGGKWMTLPELLEDHQSNEFIVDKKATKDFQDKLAMNQLTVFQLVFSLWTKVSGWMPDDCKWLWNLPCYLHFLL